LEPLEEKTAEIVRELARAREEQEAQDNQGSESYYSSSEED
jgi:hypothetical protein